MANFPQTWEKTIEKETCGSSLFKIFPNSLKDTPPPSEQNIKTSQDSPVVTTTPRVRGKTMEGSGSKIFVGGQKKSRVVVNFFSQTSAESSHADSNSKTF